MMNYSYFNILLPSFHWKEKGITVVQKTAFPEDQSAQFEFTCEKPVRLTLQIRYPSWAINGIEIIVNDRIEKVTSAAGKLYSC